MSRRTNPLPPTNRVAEIAVVLDSLNDEAVRTLAAADSAPPKLAGIMLRSLGPGTLRALEALAVVESTGHRTLQITPFGRQVMSSAAEVGGSGQALAEVRAAEFQLDRAYASYLGDDGGSGHLPVAIAVQFGHYEIRVALGNRYGELVATKHRPALVDKERSSTLQSAVEMAAELLRERAVSSDDVVGVVVAIPGPIDARTGRILVGPSSLPYLRDWGDIDLPIKDEATTLFAELLGRPVNVEVENIANLGVLGEVAYGAGAGRQNVIFLRLSAGIGVGLYLNGQLYRGADGFAGEFGHAPVVGYPYSSDPDSTTRGVPACDRCGQFGCLEVMASGISIAEALDLAGSHGIPLSLPMIAEGAAANESFREAIGRAGRYLGVALSGLILLLDPQLILIGGVLTRAGDTLLDPIREEVAERVGAFAHRVQLAEHPETAPLYGCIDVAFATADADAL